MTPLSAVSSSLGRRSGGGSVGVVGDALNATSEGWEETWTSWNRN
jgi:hypothetical protein